jgi:uncharacterized protein YbjT (DUF2867 family)
LAVFAGDWLTTFLPDPGKLDLRVLILGGYGFIGREIANRLTGSGHELVVLGRNAKLAQRLFPNAEVIAADLAKPRPDSFWNEGLDNIDAVVNASGALQTGARDNLDAVHHHSIASLVRACEASGIERFVQISSVGANRDATTEFMRSKARGDERVSSSPLSWIIVRPGLVIGPNAYGGTALIRMLASVPLVQPMAWGDAPIQTLSVADLTTVVLDAIEGRLPEREQFDLVEEVPHSLRDVIGEFRRWLGFEKARMEVRVPRVLLHGMAKIADALGYLGWRSPLRTTTLRVLSEGVIGDPNAFGAIDPRRLSDLRQTLDDLPSTLQERWFARLYLALPATLAVLVLFWTLTGLIALFNIEETIRAAGLSENAGRVAAVSGAILDISLGAAILYRPWSRIVCWGMGAVTVLYLALGTVLRPDLWSDPLGPFLKVIPILMLTLIAALLLEDRR